MEAEWGKIKRKNKEFMVFSELVAHLMPKNMDLQVADESERVKLQKQ